MFRLHETTRRRLCRTAVVLFCAVPTAATLAWIGWRHRPGMVDAQADRLGAGLQVDVNLVSWRTPRPGEVHNERLKLLDPASGALLIELERAALRRGADGVSITARAGTISAGGFDALYRRLDAWQAKLGMAPFRLDLVRLTVVSPSDVPPLVLHDVQLLMNRDDEGAVKAQLAARLDLGDASAPTVCVVLERLPGTSGDAVRATLDARAVALPCWLPAAAGAPVASLGGHATLTGVVQWEYVDGATQGAAEGVVQNVDLAALLPGGSPHAVKGQGTVTLNELRWRGRRIESLAGAVQATQLELSRSLVEAAAERLFCGLIRGAPAETFAVDQLACRFQLNGRGLTLTGNFGGEANLPAGCLATVAGRPLLMESKYVDLPAGAWVQFVSAPSSSWLPATQEAVELAELLPLPTSPGSR